MNAQQIFDLAREYGAEHPGITFDLAALLRYTRKIQEMERERWVGHGPCPNGDFVEVEDE